MFVEYLGGVHHSAYPVDQCSDHCTDPKTHPCGEPSGSEPRASEPIGSEARAAEPNGSAARANVHPAQSPPFRQNAGALLPVQPNMEMSFRARE